MAESTALTTPQARAAAKITPIGLAGSQVVVGMEILAEEIDKARASPALPFKNVLDWMRVGMTAGPLLANLFTKDTTKMGQMIDMFTRPVVYGETPLLAKTIKYAIWHYAGKTGATRGSGVNKRSLETSSGSPEGTIIRGRGRTGGRGSSYAGDQEPNRYREEGRVGTSRGRGGFTEDMPALDSAALQPG
jgi:hypothetical protein